MGNPTGFMEYKRLRERERPVAERVKDYRAVMLPVQREEIITEGARCMDCGIPFCHAMGCPVENLIPEWNDFVYKGQWFEAYKRMERTNNFPEITGRVCPALCEASCSLSVNQAPVAIKQIELTIAEYAFEHGWVVPRPSRIKTGKKVAIVGSGPAGLAASQVLARLGHDVTIFESSNKIGGVLRYGIPDFKLEKWVLDRRIEQLKAEGVVFESNVQIGSDISAAYLKRKFNAILLSAGAGKARKLILPGDGFEGIHYAMDYLIGSNKFVAGEVGIEDVLSAKGKRVLVLGGGDTGSDCVGTAVRQGASRIYQFEILPKPITWKEENNPHWPYWPKILRTSTSPREGGEREWGVETVNFSGRGIKVEKAHFVRIDWVKTNSGYEKKEIPGSGFSVDVDMVLIAAGFEHVEHSRMLSDLKINFDRRGNIFTENGYTTASEGVFAAGDARLGASLVVRAINDGRQAAEAVHRYLMGYLSP